MIITLLAGLAVLLVGLTMVIVAAFEQRTWWGLAALLPPVYPVYVALNWSNGQARNGFLMSVVGALIVAGAFYGGVASQLPFVGVREVASQIPSARPGDQPLPNEAAAAAIPSHEGAPFDPLVNEALLEPEPPLAPAADRPVRAHASAKQRAYFPVAIPQLSRYTGQRLRVATRDGEVREGKLVASNGESLSLESPRRGGEVAFEYDFDDVVTILVNADEPPPMPATSPAATSPAIPAEVVDATGEPAPTASTHVPAALGEERAREEALERELKSLDALADTDPPVVEGDTGEP